MRILAIDTATEACSAALFLDGTVVERWEVAGRSHTERLLPQVQALLAEAGAAFAQLDGIACGVGPGSFAGVRIGVGFVKGLALALDRPVAAVTSLRMLAQQALEIGARDVVAAIDARMQEVYVGVYRRGADGLAEARQSEQVAAPDAVRVDGEAAWTGVGTGWGRYEDALRARLAGTIERLEPAALPRASTALRLALPVFEAGRGMDAGALAPAYLRDKVALTLVEQAAARAGAAARG